jgi:hypothetical protein
VSPEPEINITHNTCFMPPCSIAISQAKWHSLWRMHRIRHLPFALALKSAKSLHLPALPSANANVFAIRFSVKICKACGEC